MKRLILPLMVAVVSCTPDTAAVKKYIAENWDSTIRENREDDQTLIGVPAPYTVPCASDTFQEMYYWDSFFTNEGLILSGRVDQAINNCENIAYLIERYGFMPNGTRTWYLNRSQPPYFALMVEAIYKQTGDVAWLERMYGVIEKEYGFWMSHRATPCGLNRYSSEAGEALVWEFLATGGKRIGADYDSMGLSVQERYTIGRNFAAEAESGWDFTPRFERRCEDFCPVDLNANLYFYERFLADHAEMLGKNSTVWQERAAARRNAIISLMQGEDGCFYDYDYVNDRLSNVKSGAVFNLLAALVLNVEEAEALIAAVLPELETEHGISVCAKGDYTYNYQWSYPNCWPPVQYMAERGLMEYGYGKEAVRIAGKYVKTVCAVFADTGRLWEKYDMLSGNVAGGVEYETPAMMGWSAGAFMYSCSIIEK